MAVFAKSENYFLGKWIYKTEDIFISLEIKEDGKILYYTHTLKEGKIASENWLEGQYKYQINEKLKTDELIVVYIMAEYSPYSYMDEMPLSYADYSINDESVITICKEDINIIKVCFSDYESGFGVHEKCLIMIKDSE